MWNRAAMSPTNRGNLLGIWCMTRKCAPLVYNTAEIVCVDNQDVRHHVLYFVLPAELTFLFTRLRKVYVRYDTYVGVRRRRG